MRKLAGILLICAAILKSVQLLNGPGTAMASPWDNWVLLIQIGVEFGVGALAVSGLYRRTLRWLLVLLFICLASRSLYLTIGGARSCGCFGPVQIHPWATFLVDLLVVFGLIVSPPYRRMLPTTAFAVPSTSLSNWMSTRFAIAAAMGLLAMITAFLMQHADRYTGLTTGAMGRPVGLMILEPERWVGQKLPIAESIDIDLSKGSWVILFHRHDCPVCREALTQHESVASSKQNIAFVEVPPYGDFGSRVPACHYGRLSNDRGWFVETPIEIQLEDGRVTAVKGYGH